MKNKTPWNLVIVAMLVILTSVVLVVIIGFFFGAEQVDTLGEDILKETAKILLQLIIIGVIGVAIGLGGFNLRRLFASNIPFRCLKIL